MKQKNKDCENIKIFNKEICTNYIIFAILIFGIIIRLVFMLCMPINKMQYDIGIKSGFNDEYYDKFFEFDRKAIRENGHLEYILKLYDTGKLLDSNSNQGYHPPLSHIISAIFLRFLDLFGASNSFKIEALEFPPFIYSIFILIISYRIMREIGMKKKEIIIPFSLITFHPIMIYMSRLINNDELLTLFSLLSVLYLIKWHKNPTYKNIIVLAFSIGLGGLTKNSIVVMAVPFFCTLMSELFKVVNNSDDTDAYLKVIKRIIIQILIFTIISVPLILAYPIRNAIKFEQPPFSIVTASDELKVASTKFADRWIINKELFDNILKKDASNVWAYVINSSIIFMFNIVILPNIVAISLKILSIILILLSIIGMIKVKPKSIVLLSSYFSWILRFYLF